MKLKTALILVLTSAIFSGSINAQLLKKTPEKIDRKIVRATEGFLSMQIEAGEAIPAWALKAAKGIVIINEVKAGFGIGAEAGGGVALIRNPKGEWSAPAFVGAGATSYGLQIGAEQTDIVLLLMTDESLKFLKNGSSELGVDLTATAGKRDAVSENATTTNLPILVYVNSGGLFAGASIKGGGIVPAEKRNQVYYGKNLEAILFKPGTEPSASGKKLIDALNRYSK